MRMAMDHIRPPNVSELIYNFSSGQILSTLDLAASYWQVSIREDHQQYTGFMYEGHTYIFRVLPFGYCSSVGSFIRALNKILGPEVDDFVIAFVDDLLIFSPSPEAHLEHLKIIFNKFKAAGVTIKLKKSILLLKR